MQPRKTSGSERSRPSFSPRENGLLESLFRLDFRDVLSFFQNIDEELAIGVDGIQISLETISFVLKARTNDFELVLSNSG